jgi:adenylate cyclase
MPRLPEMKPPDQGLSTPPSAAAPTELLGEVLHALGTAVALVHPESLEVLIENARFREWFPPTEPENPFLCHRLPVLDPDRLRDRMGRGRPFRLDTETTQGNRPLPVQIQVRPVPMGEGERLLVEGTSISRQREAEYMLDSYARLMERQARELEQERARAEKLLLNIMPRRVYDELRDFGTTSPQSFDAVSVLMLDFVGFTEMAVSHDPSALISELNDVFTSFDRISEHFRCERIKTIGDAYMAVAGLPEPDPEHDCNLARVALRMRRFLEKRNRSATNHWRCRIGIGRGPVIGSIVGIHKYVYDLFGPAVNLASRLEQQASPMQILVARDSWERLRDDFVLRSVGSVELKGFGSQEVFALEDEARRTA